MKRSNKLVFFGNERLATAAKTTVPTLSALVKAGYEIEAVIASHEDAVSRQKRDLEIGPVAHKFGIPVILPGKKISLADKLARHRTEAAILVAFGKIIPQEVINLFPAGIINVHPSLLPKLRGPTPIESAILEGLEGTGVSLMKITAGMDAGPVYAQVELGLSGHETKFELAQKLNQAGAELLVAHLEDILCGKLQPKPQDDLKTTYTKLINKADGVVNWNKSAEQLEREVRAYLGWPKSRAEIFGHQVVITKSRVAKDESDGDLVMECSLGPYANGWGLRPKRRSWLEILELTAPSGRTISGAEFLRGYNVRG